MEIARGDSLQEIGKIVGSRPQWHDHNAALLFSNVDGIVDFDLRVPE